MQDRHTADLRGSDKIFKTEESDFYGPVQVIGFDAENLYIADEGAVFGFKDNIIKLIEKKNRIAIVHKADNRLRTCLDSPEEKRYKS